MAPLQLMKLMAMLATYENGDTAFEKFLKNGDNNLLVFWQHIKNCRGKYTDRKKDRITAYSVIFGKDKPYNRDLMGKYVLKMRRLLEVFLIKLENETTASGQRIQAEMYQRNDLSERAEISNQAALRLAAEEEELKRYLIEWQIYSEEFSRTKSEEAFSKMNEALNLFYSITKLHMIIEEATRHVKQRKSSNAKLRKKTNKLLLVLPKERTSLINVQLAALEYFLNTPCPKRYTTLKQSYFSNFKKFKSYRPNLLLSVINALTTIPNPTDELREDYIYLYQFGIKHELLAPNGYISSQEFDNIIFVAEARDNSQLLQMAIEKLAPKILIEKYRRRSLFMAKSFVLFMDGKYEETNDELTKLGRCNELPYYIVYRRHLLKIMCLFKQTPIGSDLLIALRHEQNNFRKMLDRFGNGKNGTKELTQEQVDSFLNTYRALCMIAEKCSQEEINNFIDSCNGLILQLQWLRIQIVLGKK